MKKKTKKFKKFGLTFPFISFRAEAATEECRRFFLPHRKRSAAITGGACAVTHSGKQLELEPALEAFNG